MYLVQICCIMNFEGNVKTQNTTLSHGQTMGPSSPRVPLQLSGYSIQPVCGRSWVWLLSGTQIFFPTLLTNWNNIFLNLNMLREKYDLPCHPHPVKKQWEHLRCKQWNKNSLQQKTPIRKNMDVWATNFSLKEVHWMKMIPWSLTWAIAIRCWNISEPSEAF